MTNREATLERRRGLRTAGIGLGLLLAAIMSLVALTHAATYQPTPPTDRVSSTRLLPRPALNKLARPLRRSLRRLLPGESVLLWGETGEESGPSVYVTAVALVGRAGRIQHWLTGTNGAGGLQWTLNAVGSGESGTGRRERPSPSFIGELRAAHLAPSLLPLSSVHSWAFPTYRLVAWSTVRGPVVGTVARGAWTPFFLPYLGTDS